MSKKALIAMSGGVDSSVAAFFIKQQGFDCTGVTMKLFNNDDAGIDNDKACCSVKDVDDARSVAHWLEIPHYVFNFTADFKNQVIGRFIDAYQNGATPNPCIDCNKYLKFERLLSRAKQLDIDYIVTGHYARIEYDCAQGRYLLRKAVDCTKDQSYVLYFMSQEQLKHTLLPLGGLSKSEVRNIAAEQGLINAKKRDSQDICFVQNNDYAGFIEQYTGRVFESGDFVDMQGNILGRHRGIIRYTIGQRKGIGIALQTPMYVYSKCITNNTVTLCDNESLFTKSLNASDFNWIVGCPVRPVRVKAKLRYKHEEQNALVEQIDDNTVHIEFDRPQRAIAKGQAVVLYDGDIVVGGGTII